MRLKNGFLIMALASSLASCSKLDDMGDNAKAASENSGRAANASEIASKAASESREEIANGRMLTRSGAASLSRREALKALKGDWTSFEMMVTEGSKFVKALEFQTWTGQRYDSEEYLDALKRDGMREFFRAVIELNGGEELVRGELTPFKMKEEKKLQAYRVYALAVAMHGLHNVQEHVVAPRETNLEEGISFYELLKRSLKKVHAVELGTISFAELKEYEQVAYQYKDMAIALTESRANMLLSMALAKTTDLKKKGLVGLASLLKTKKSGKLSFDFLELNLGEQDKVNDYLDAAAKVETFMAEIGDKVSVLPELKRLYSKVDLTKINNPDNVRYDNDQEEVEFQKYLGQMNVFFTVEGGKFKAKN